MIKIKIFKEFKKKNNIILQLGEGIKIINIKSQIEYKKRKIEIYYLYICYLNQKVVLNKFAFKNINKIFLPFKKVRKARDYTKKLV